MKNNIEFDRNRFKTLANFYKQYGLAPQTSSIVLLEKFSAGKSKYRFKVGDEGDYQVPHVLRRRLKRNDLLTAKDIMVGIYIEADAKPGTGVIHTYPFIDTADPSLLPTGYSGLTNADAEALYNGTLSLKTGQTLNYTSFPLRSFRLVPQTQPFGETPILPQYDYDAAKFNFPEQVSFVGTSDQYIDIEFAGDGLNIAAAQAGYSAYLMVIVDGWLVEGGTNPDLKIAENPMFPAL